MSSPRNGNTKEGQMSYEIVLFSSDITKTRSQQQKRNEGMFIFEDQNSFIFKGPFSDEEEEDWGVLIVIYWNFLPFCVGARYPLRVKVRSNMEQSIRGISVKLQS